MLSETEINAIAAGGALAEMTLCLEEDKRAGVNAARQKMRELLPADAFRLLFQ